MTPKAILFDLDGTLTDSGEGIINCASLALKHFGLPIPDKQAMRVFVGPPLRDTLVQFGIKEADVEEALQIFRGRYTTHGIYENELYPGIPELLSNLKEQGHKLYVATSKPEVMALTVLNRFEISKYFDIIAGATLDSSRDSKAAVIAYLMEQAGDTAQPVMVGDTAFDVIGAATHGIPTIGVAWGYGKVEDMEKAGAAAIAQTTAELYELLQK